MEIAAAVSRKYHLDSIERVMRVLDCFTLDTPELRLTDLSTRTGMSKTQILRIVSTLEEGGYLTRDSATKRYQLGMRIFQLGIVAQEQMTLRRIAHPVLERLVAETQETARLVLFDDFDPVCVDLVESPRGVRVHARLGGRMPWNAGSSGKVILAYLSPEQREHVLSHTRLVRYNQHTITDLDELQRQLEVIRRQGYFVNETGDLIEETRGIAAPVFKLDGQILGTISLTIPASRWDEDVAAHCTRLVREAAAHVSSLLGFQPGPVSLNGESGGDERELAHEVVRDGSV